MSSLISKDVYQEGALVWLIMMVFCRYIMAVPAIGNRMSMKQFIRCHSEEIGIGIQRVEQNMACWKFASLQLTKDFRDFP